MKKNSASHPRNTKTQMNLYSNGLIIYVFAQIKLILTSFLSFQFMNL